MDLLDRFKEGDLAAFEILFRQFQAEVYGWILRIVRDAGVAEDLTVETFWHIYRARSRFNPRAPFGAGARRLAPSLPIDHLRHRRPEVELRTDVPQAPPTDPIVCREMHSSIAAAFRCLPVKLRVAATLSLIEERSHQEIAEALGTTEGAVRVRVFRAVQLLREQLTRMGVKP